MPLGPLRSWVASAPFISSGGVGSPSGLESRMSVVPQQGPGWYQVGDQVQWWDGQSWFVSPGPASASLRCWSCGAVLPAESHFCASCGKSVVMPLSGGSPVTSINNGQVSAPAAQQPAPVNHGFVSAPVSAPSATPTAAPVSWGGQVTGSLPHVHYAGWWRRYAAALVATFVRTAIGFAIAFPLVLLLAGGKSDEEAQSLFSVFLPIVEWIVYFSWIFVARSRTGAWVDMKVTGIALVDADTLRPLSYGRAFLRSLASVLNGLPLLIGFFAPLWTRRNQSFADMLCNTVVVHTSGGVDPSTGRVRGLDAPKRRRFAVVAINSAPFALVLFIVLVIPSMVMAGGPGPMAYGIAEDIYTEGVSRAEVAGSPVADSFFDEAANDVAPNFWESSINRVLVTTSEGVGVAYVCDSGPSTEVCN